MDQRDVIKELQDCASDVPVYMQILEHDGYHTAEVTNILWDRDRCCFVLANSEHLMWS